MEENKINESSRQRGTTVVVLQSANIFGGEGREGSQIANMLPE